MGTAALFTSPATLFKRRDAPALPLGCLAAVPDLKQAIISKKLAQGFGSLALLASSLEALESAGNGVTAAIANLLDLTAREEAEMVMQGGPVFLALPLSSISGIMQHIADEHASELRAKRTVVADFAAALDTTKARLDGNLEHSSTGVLTLPESPKSRRKVLEAFLQVHIAAWMLCANLNEGMHAADLAFIASEAASC
jgi:hypothetical protein